MRWTQVRESSILVDRASAFGEIKNTKTGASRTVRMAAPLRHDLANWSNAQGSLGPEAFVFPSASGGVWSPSDHNNWRRRVFHPAAEAAGVQGVRRYDLRHTFVSLCLKAGQSLPEVARQAGHGIDMTVRTYAHVISDLEDTPRISIDEAILDARRGAGVPDLYPNQ